ncbi:MAG: hypothetical protein IKK21_00895 [Clostridia bacterium]|nr:hypothetical protein [Clostridia bacterium]
MLKRLICLILTLVFALGAAGASAESEAGALTWEELEAWVASYKERAMQTQPLNDPTEEAAYSEDGYAFIYEFATLYMDRPEMTAEAVVRSVVVTDPEETAPRGTRIDHLSSEVLAAYYNENPDLDGDSSFAALYLTDLMPDGAAWGWVQRDGQRLMTIQYAVHEQLATGGEGYTDAGLIYTIQDNLVAAIRAYGLDSRMSEADVNETLAEVTQVAAATGYAQVPVSYVGTDLDAFDRDDLIFAGMDFLTVPPEEAETIFGAAREDHWMEDEGSYLRTMEFACCTMTFVYDGQKQNPRLEIMTIDMDGMEGPRAVRIGDTLSSVLCRFRYGEGEWDGLTEMLYGTKDAAPYGMAEYGDDASASLYYAMKDDGGRTIQLYMYFEQMYLSEITLYYVD